jgi:hypothetical protein
MGETLPALIPDLVELGTRAAEFARTSRAPATGLAYRSDWGAEETSSENCPGRRCIAGRWDFTSPSEIHGRG